MIGDEIEITVVDIRGDKVRLGITAPTKIAVHRKEVYDAIRAENARAAMISSEDAAHLRVASGGGTLPRGPAPRPIALTPPPSTSPQASHTTPATPTPRPRATGTGGGGYAPRFDRS
jgi:carbon storage regulator